MYRNYSLNSRSDWPFRRLLSLNWFREIKLCVALFFVGWTDVIEQNKTTFLLVDLAVQNCLLLKQIIGKI